MSDERIEEANARSITFRTDDGHVTIFMKYLNVGPSEEHVMLTLKMTPDNMETFARSLLDKAAEARASSVRH